MLKDTKKEAGEEMLGLDFTFIAVEVLTVITKNTLYLSILNLKFVHCLIK